MAKLTFKYCYFQWGKQRKDEDEWGLLGFQTFRIRLILVKAMNSFPSKVHCNLRILPKVPTKPMFAAR